MKRKIILITVFALCFGLVLYASRGPNISNALKKKILPELESMTGNKFISQSIIINIFPFALEMKGVKAFDGNGERIFTASRIKAHIGLMGLLRKEMLINRLVIKNADIKADRDQLDAIIKNAKKYIAEGQKFPLKLVLKAIDIKDAALLFSDASFKLNMTGLNTDILLSKNTRLRFLSKETTFTLKGIPESNAMVQGILQLKGEQIEIESLRLFTHNSELKTAGSLGFEKLNGELQTEIRLVVETVKKLFGLKKNGDGQVYAKGIIRLDGLKSLAENVFVDLKLKGDFYLETLMELLGVKEKLKGYLNFKGGLSGHLNNLKGNGTAELKKGNLFDVDIDSVKCNVSYANKELLFTGGKAHLYNGTASAEAVIRLPYVDYYSFKVNAKDINSKGVFKLIGWDPDISPGTISGVIASSGASFNPAGSFHYQSRSKSGNILKRINEIKGEFNTLDDETRFENISISTGMSNLSAAGSINVALGRLNFTAKGTTTNINDVASPYFTALSGPAEFSSSVYGTFNNPAVSITINSDNPVLSTAALGDSFGPGTYNLDSIKGTVTYSKNLLAITKLSAKYLNEEIIGKGNIHFKKARTLFDVNDPDYELSLSANNIDIRTFSEILKYKRELHGKLDADFKITGKPEYLKIAGVFQAADLSLNNKYSVDKVEGNAVFADKKFFFDGINIKKGQAIVNLTGMLSLDQHFSINASGQKISILDTVPENIKDKLKANFLQELMLSNVRVRGDGDFNNPNIEVTGDISGGTYRGQSFGKGSIHAALRGKDMALNARLLDGKMSVKAEAQLKGTTPWTLNVDLLPARYDFIIAGFLKNVPDDLFLNLSGKVNASGDSDHISAVARISKAHLYSYGNAFANNKDIVATLEDKKLSIERFSMKSDNSEFTVGGNIFIGKSYALLFEGTSALSPFKSFSKTIDVLRGNSSFVFSVSGDWDNPKINGGMDVSNGTLGFKNIPYRLTSMTAYFYIDENRIVVENAAAKLSGGDINVHGTAHIQGFSLKKFFLESTLRRITASVSKDFWVNFDGNLYFHGTPESQSIVGDIGIRRARYSERIEWKSWLLKAREKDLPKPESTKLDRINLNVKVSGSNILIDNNIARTTMIMDVLLKGTIGQPILLGKVETREGFVYFRNNQFKILKTNVDFSNPNSIRPYFDIVAETRVTNYKIRLSLDGYVEQFNLSLSSDPPLEEADVFSLLTVGYVGKNTKGLEGGIGAAEATSFITGKLQDVMEERLKTVTGIDRIQIAPYVSKSTGTLTPRVTVAKRLLGDKLYATYTTSIGTVDEQIWKLEYLLSENASLVGVRDEKGGLGGDIKFRFEFK